MSNSVQDLPNSRRRFYKATYVPIKLTDDHHGTADGTSAPREAMTKLSYVRSLKPVSEEVGLLRSHWDRRGQLTESRGAMLEHLSNLAGLDSPSLVLSLAPRFGSIAHDDLIALAGETCDAHAG